MSMLMKSVFRSFTSSANHPKGGIGKEGSMGNNFTFPRHKELFNEGYYDEDQDKSVDSDTHFESKWSKQMRQENPRYKSDAVDYGTNNEQNSLDIEGGVMQSYRKLTGHTMDELLNNDYWQSKRNISMKAAKMFNTVNSNEKEMMNNTKNYTMRHRLNRDLDFNDDFRKKYLSKEYGNYEKYDLNKVETKYDEGEQTLDNDKFYEKYMKLIKRLPTIEAKEMKEKRREDIKDMLTDQQQSHNTFGSEYLEWKTHEDVGMHAES